MDAVEVLSQIRQGWIDHLTQVLAKEAGVRAVFHQQLERFYRALMEAVAEGEDACLDEVLSEWAEARTHSELEDQEISLAPLLTEIVLQTRRYLERTLRPEEGARLMWELLPYFTHAYEYVTRREVQKRVEHLRRELQAARKSLRQLDQSKSDFVSVAAHELKTPLTLIEGYTSMLRELYPAGDQTSRPILLLKGIDNGTRRMREIVDDLIDLSMIDNQLLQLTYQPVWLNRIFNALQDELKETLRARNQILEVRDFPGSEEMTFADATRIYQAFRNLLANAIKYTPDGGKITVDGRMLPGFIEVTVTDNGIGIDPEDHTRIFRKFAQLGDVSLHSSGKTKFKGGGPGLGLPITKGIIEAHGGSIWVESQGHDEVRCPGSTFHVMLPICKEPPDEITARLFRPLVEDEK